ncbi:MAG: hypothetical protein JSV52_01625 [Candidatus Zixiibacteriota bacterium]|nr:MAG: hypothetical protein JSV52_01625 [candidate division Zixibacteria bacterium]
MIKKFLTIMIALSAAFFVGCEDDDPILIDMAPAAPQGVYSVTGDHEVYIYWYGPYESDIEGYIIWRSFEPIHNYQQVGYVDAVSNPNLDLLIYEYIDRAVVNGATYYYAVSSVDKAGQVSELSAENVFDTPRPDGAVTLADSGSIMNQSGYNFAAQAVVSATSEVADVFIDMFDGIFYLNARDIFTDIQDMGYTESFDDIGWAPPDGWSEVGWMEIIQDHTYVIWTRDNHFAKLRVESINSITVDFLWAYQTVDGLQELKPVVMEKPVHGPEYLIKSF